LLLTAIFKVGNFGKVGVGSQKFGNIGVGNFGKVGVGYFTSDSAALVPVVD